MVRSFLNAIRPLSWAQQAADLEIGLFSPRDAAMAYLCVVMTERRDNDKNTSIMLSESPELEYLSRNPVDDSVIKRFISSLDVEVRRRLLELGPEGLRRLTPHNFEDLNRGIEAEPLDVS